MRSRLVTGIALCALLGAAACGSGQGDGLFAGGGAVAGSSAKSSGGSPASGGAGAASGGVSSSGGSSGAGAGGLSMGGAAGRGGSGGVSASGGSSGSASGGRASGGAGGGAGKTCQQQIAALSTLLTTAQRCTPDQTSACAGFVTNECGCMVAVDNPDSTDAKAYITAVSALLGECGVSCAAACPNPMVAECSASGSGSAGRCLGK